MRADLHLHSIYSDGLYSPDFLCALAKERGLDLLSITDHDTLSGEGVKRETAKKYGLSYLSGWEISAYEGLNKIHILGYGCQKGSGYERFLKERKEASQIRAEESVKKFNALGVPVTMADVESMRKDPTSPFHTMHIARAAALYLPMTEGEVYMVYLNIGKPANCNYGRPSPKQAIDCIHALGGVASVAHPGRIYMDGNGREEFLEELARYGVDGIEGIYSSHTDEETEYFCAFAKKWGLFVSGGSDTHREDGEHTLGQPVYHVDENLLKKVKIF